jgi:hypothetical protein
LHADLNQFGWRGAMALSVFNTLAKHWPKYWQHQLVSSMNLNAPTTTQIETANKTGLLAGFGKMR